MEKNNMLGQPVKEPQKNKFNNILEAMGLVLILLIICLGALLAGRAWDPVWNPFRPHAERVNQIHLVE